MTSVTDKTRGKTEPSQHSVASDPSGKIRKLVSSNREVKLIVVITPSQMGVHPGAIISEIGLDWMGLDHRVW